MQAKSGNPRGVVLLDAFDESHQFVLNLTLAVDEYYEKSHPLIDDEFYRREKRIFCLEGRIYDYDGILDQQFTNKYDDQGQYLRGRAVHSDGTIYED